MKKTKVSLREIMEDDDHPLMQEWVEQLLPLLKPIIEANDLQFDEEE